MRQQYNLYYGTVDGPLKVKYRTTKMFDSDELALKAAYEEATSIYYKNEGKFGLPDYPQIQKESDITGVNILKLYGEHVKDLMRWYAIPTILDTVENKHLKFI